MSLKIPAKKAQARAHAARSLTPLDESPATQGVGISIVATGAPPPVTTPQYTFDLSTCTTTGATPCTANADGSRTYTIATPLVPIGTYVVQIATWDAAPVAGSFAAAHELSEGAATVSIAQVNSTVNVALNGIPASVVITPIPGQSHVITQGNGAYSLIGNSTTLWSVAALDHDGYIIAGDAQPMMTFTDSANALSVSSSSGSVYAIKALSAQPTAVTLAVTATAATAAGNVVATGGESILPMQEMWQTENGAGIFGFMLDPNNAQQGAYRPPGFGQFPNASDIITSTDNFGQLTQDADGNLWVEDLTTNKLVEYKAPVGSTPPQPTGVSIDISGITAGGVAADSNGYLYIVDSKRAMLLVYTINSLANPYTVSLNPGAASISVVPSGSGVPSGLPGTLVIGSGDGVDLYSNAVNGAPALIKSFPPAYGNGGGTYAAAVAPDTGTMWTMELDSSGTIIGLYSTASGPSITSLGISLGSWSDDAGYIAPAIADYAFTSDGTNGNSDEMYNYVSPSITHQASFSFNGSSSYGVLVEP
ncbi:MAG TPA: hypothetical protein VFN49_01240 [Candidatus Aquilonibacter sp.]|nr:hypothetical protein [Candidatus Aquilonibacter sp.]